MQARKHPAADKVVLQMEYDTLRLSTSASRSRKGSLTARDVSTPASLKMRVNYLSVCVYVHMCVCVSVCLCVIS